MDTTISAVTTDRHPGRRGPDDDLDRACAHSGGVGSGGSGGGGGIVEGGGDLDTPAGGDDEVTGSGLASPAGPASPARPGAMRAARLAEVRRAARLQRRRRRRIRRTITLGVATVPWAWFALRGGGGVIEFAAITMPLWATLAGGVLAAGAAFTRRAEPLVVALSVLLVAVIGVVGPWRPVSGGGPIAPGAELTVVAANVAHHEDVELVEAIRRRDADVVVVSELAEGVDTGLLLVYPYVVRSEGALRPWSPEPTPIEERANQAGVAVYSRYPIEELADTTGLPYGLPGVRVRVDGPGGPIVLYGLHLTKASPVADDDSVGYAAQEVIADAVRAAVGQEADPVIVAGDLNLSDRQEEFRQFSAGMRDAVRAGRWAGPTSAKESLAWRALLLRIDHVLVTPTLCARSGGRFPLPGSDHRGVAATVGQCAG